MIHGRELRSDEREIDARHFPAPTPVRLDATNLLNCGVVQGCCTGGGTRPAIYYGTERMRQKLFVVVTGALVNTHAPTLSAWLVNCGTQLADTRLNVRSIA